MKRTAIVTVLAIGLALALTAAATGAAQSNAGANESNASANATFGAEVSAFMQASSQEAAGEVDQQTFAAALNRTEDPEERRRLIQQREAALEERQQRLAARQWALNDSSGLARFAIATEVAVGASELAESANGTERAAEAAGLNTTELAEIRANATDMHGRAVAELAVGLAGPANDGGPPGDIIGVGNTSEDGEGENASEDAEGENASEEGEGENASENESDREDRGDGEGNDGGSGEGNDGEG
ncbi:hypothetical protein BRC75_05360, partial [Halobacteriales archaeon QH_7_69_31]